MQRVLNSKWGLRWAGSLRLSPLQMHQRPPAARKVGEISKDIKNAPDCHLATVLVLRVNRKFGQKEKRAKSAAGAKPKFGPGLKTLKPQIHISQIEA